jgi:hypothetical protein
MPSSSIARGEIYSSYVNPFNGHNPSPAYLDAGHGTVLSGHSRGDPYAPSYMSPLVQVPQEVYGPSNKWQQSLQVRGLRPAETIRFSCVNSEFIPISLADLLSIRSISEVPQIMFRATDPAFASNTRKAALRISVCTLCCAMFMSSS